MIPKGKKLLKIAGAFAIVLGMLSVFIGFYIMASGMSLDEAAPQEQMKMMKMLSIGGMYIMANGAFHAVAGFVGFLNAGELEYALKCRKYGFGLIAFTVTNIIVLAFITLNWKSLTLFSIIIPAVIAAVYFTGAQMNVNEEKKITSEN